MSNREAFEAAYAAHFQKNTGKEITLDEIASMRTGDEYNFNGRQNPYLNGMWDGWQLRQSEIDQLRQSLTDLYTLLAFHGSVPDEKYHLVTNAAVLMEKK